MQEIKEDIELHTLKDVKKVAVALQHPLTRWFDSHSLLRKIACMERCPNGSIPYFDADLPDTKVYYYDEDKELSKSTKNRIVIGVFELKTKNKKDD